MKMWNVDQSENGDGQPYTPVGAGESDRVDGSMHEGLSTQGRTKTSEFIHVPDFTEKRPGGQGSHTVYARVEKPIGMHS